MAQVHVDVLVMAVSCLSIRDQSYQYGMDNNDKNNGRYKDDKAVVTW